MCMNLDVNNWKEYKISDIFTVKYGVNLELVNCEVVNSSDKGAVNFVARTSSNNGVVARIKEISGVPPQPAWTITCAGGGSVLSTFLQSEEFYSGRDLYLLLPKFDMSKYAKMFCLTVIKGNKYRFNYGRQANKSLPNLLLKLPSRKDGTPDFDFMDKYIKSLHHKPITTQLNINPILDLNIEHWQEFKLNDIFNFKKGKRLTKADMVDGHLNYLGAISENNGVRQQIEVEESQIYTANCITVNYNGSVGEAFYQSEPFWASDDVNVLYAKNWAMNKYNAMFIITVIKANKYRFSYGRKWTLEKMKESIIKLPISQPNVPNFNYMEQYIKKLSYSDRI